MKRIPRITFCCLACLCLAITSSLAFGQALHTPKPGSAERTAILDALRVPVQERAKTRVVFHNVGIRVQDGWAWADVIAMDRTGKNLVFGDVATGGILRKTKNGWKVLFWGTASDAGVILEAKKRYPKAPRKIFEYSSCVQLLRPSFNAF